MAFSTVLFLGVFCIQACALLLSSSETDVASLRKKVEIAKGARQKQAMTTSEYSSFGKVGGTDFHLEPIVRQRGCKKGGPCKKNEYVCMSMMMLKYVNQHRRKMKLKALKPGTKKQLKNAMMHSKVMMKKEKLCHQNLSAVNLGCGSWFSGENVAVNHGLLSKAPTDPARMCVAQFIKSPPHRKNLENKNFETAVMGVVVGGNGYFWCTQTFAQRTNFGPGECAPVGKAGNDRSGAAAMKKPVTNGHTFDVLAFGVNFGKGRRATFKLDCNKGKCKYCMYVKKKKKMCLRIGQSIALDKAI